MVVDRDRQDLLSFLLPDHVILEELEDLGRLGQLVELELRGLGQLFFDDLVAQIDALVADVDTKPGDQLLDLLLRLAAERALQQVATVSELGHLSESSRAALTPRPAGPRLLEGTRPIGQVSSITCRI